MNGMKARELAEASMLVAVAAIIIVMSWYIPFFMLVGVVIWPIPIALLTFKYNIRISVISLAVLFAIIIGFISPLAAISLILVYGLPAVVLGICLRKGYSSYITVTAVSISTFLTYIISLKLSVLLFGIDILAQSNKMLDDSLQMSRELLINAGMTQQQVNQVLPLEFGSASLNMFLPGALAIVSIAGAYINYYVVGKIFKRLRLRIEEAKPFDQWYLNRNLSFGLFFITIITGLLMLLKVDNGDTAFNSVYMLFNFAFIIDGLAVISWFLKRRGVPGKLVVFIIIVLIITNIAALVFYLGFIDYIIDFRKINPSRRRTPPGE